MKNEKEDNPWPDLTSVELRATLSTLHLWTQIVGKTRLMLTPWENHGWHVPFYLSARGLSTGLIFSRQGSFTLEFDLIAEELVARTSAGRDGRVALRSGRVAEFYRQTRTMIEGLGIEVEIDTMPSEIAKPTRFDEDETERDYHADTARLYWRAALEVQRVFQLFRTRFTGKISPIHLFWGAFDLAVTRFSGREAPRHPGGAPFLNDAVAREAYSREVSSAGFWPNLEGNGGPSFYSYAYPVPAGYADRPVRPSAARFDRDLGEFVLTYAAVQASEDPDATLLDFLQTTYEAAADLGAWDRSLLEREQGRVGVPPEGS